MFRQWQKWGALGVLLCGMCGTASAEISNVKWSGFLRAAVTASDINEPSYLGRIDKFGNYDDSQFGLNVSANLGGKWTVAGQLYMAGREESWNTHLDWGYVTYQATDEFSASFGRIKFPGLLLSETVDIGILYPWLRPPEELYHYEVLGPNISIESFDGARATYAAFAGDAEYIVEAYGGGLETEDAYLDQLIGARAALVYGPVTAQVSHTVSRISLKANSERESSLDQKRQESTALGIMMDYRNVVAYAEHAEGSVNDNQEVDTTAWYATLGYRFGKWMPHVTKAEFEHENKLGQESLTIGLKYTLNPSTTLKFDYKTVDPTEREDDEPTENPAGFFEEMPEEDEVTIYGIALDLVF